MKRFMVLWLVLGSAWWAVAAETFEILEVAEATPGRSGVCVTEMAGGERVEIPLTVLGTIGSPGPEGEIVLVRLEGPPFEETGIIQGVSGSPVYIDGKLLGALAFGWPFSKEPIGGVTPFGRMLEVEPGPTAGSGVLARPPLEDFLDAAHQGKLGEFLVDWLLPEGSQAMAPLPVSVSVGGWWVPSGDGWLSESWRRMGWVGMPGGGAGSTDSDVPTEVLPGAMVAGVMVDGDAMMAAAGTVTEVRGDKVWAFGHPMLGTGTVEMPLARAHVVAVLPSVMTSFKFFTVGEAVGALVADRTHGVLGNLGREARMVPVRVSVDDRQYSFRSVRHPVMLPVLTAYLVQASHRVRGRVLGDQTVATRFEIRYADLEPAVIEASFAGFQAPSDAAAFIAAVVAYLEGSGFAAPEIELVDIRLDTDEELRTATIVEVTPERRVVQPGDELDVHFRLRPYRGREELHTLTLQVPEGIPDGSIDLVAADGAAWSAYELQMRPLNPASFADEVRLLNRLQPATDLVAVLERKDVGMAVDGGSLSAPAGLVVQLRSALGPNLKTTAYSVFARTNAQLPYPVTGAQRISLTVRSRD